MDRSVNGCWRPHRAILILGVCAQDIVETRLESTVVPMLLVICLSNLLAHLRKQCLVGSFFIHELTITWAYSFDISIASSWEHFAVRMMNCRFDSPSAF